MIEGHKEDSMEDKNLTTHEAAERSSQELQDTELEKVSGGFNPQPDPPRDNRG